MERAATETLASLGVPAAVLDPTGRVLAANSLLRSEDRHVRWLASDRLAFVDPRTGERLQKTLETLGTVRGVSCFASRPSASTVSVVHLVPMRSGLPDVSRDTVALLTLTPVSTRDAPDAGLIRALFELSAGEARVAASITHGRTIAQIAAGAGVSRETVRTQLKAVMAKTGTTRQAEVVALLAGLRKIPIR